MTCTPQKVLIVEDNADSRQMLEKLLQLDGHAVQVAEDGRAGLEAIQREDFDLALVDIGLPELDGYEVARRIRRDCAHRRVYLVALTGYGREADRKAAREAGFDAHLVKPLNPADLDRVLQRPR